MPVVPQAPSAAVSVFFNVKRKYPGSGEGLQVIAFKTSGASVAPEGKRPGVRVIMREASFRDYDQIAALQIRNGLSTKSYEDWLALWSDNPVYKKRVGHWP